MKHPGHYTSKRILEFVIFRSMLLFINIRFIIDSQKRKVNISADELVVIEVRLFGPQIR